MSRIRSLNTQPEVLVRSILHRLGYRFSLHREDLPGRPDIVLPRYKAVIFVHGCFWHRHAGCQLAYKPKSRQSFWKEKFDENVKRDRRQNSRLRNLGWRCLVVWECQIGRTESLAKRLDGFLRPVKTRKKTLSRLKRH